MQTLLRGVFTKVSGTEISFIANNQWRDQLIKDVKRVPLGVQQRFYQAHRAFVVPGVKHLEWRTRSGATAREWLYSLTNSRGERLFTHVFDPVADQMVLYFKNEVSSDFWRWCPTALLCMGRQLSEVDLMSDDIMSSIFTSPAEVRSVVTGQQLEYAAVVQLRADLDALVPLSIVVVKSTKRQAIRPQVKKGVFTITASDKSSKRRNQKSNASVTSASIGDDTTLSTKMTASTTRTTRTATTPEQALALQRGSMSVQSGKMSATAHNYGHSVGTNLAGTYAGAPSVRPLSDPDTQKLGQQVAKLAVVRQPPSSDNFFQNLSTIGRAKLQSLSFTPQNFPTLPPNPRVDDITQHPAYKELSAAKEREEQEKRVIAAECASAKSDLAELRIKQVDMARQLKALQELVQHPSPGPETSLPLDYVIPQPTIVDYVQLKSVVETPVRHNKGTGKRTRIRSPVKSPNQLQVMERARAASNSYSVVGTDAGSSSATKSMDLVGTSDQADKLPVLAEVRMDAPVCDRPMEMAMDTSSDLTHLTVDNSTSSEPPPVEPPLSKVADNEKSNEVAYRIVIQGNMATLAAKTTSTSCLPVASSLRRAAAEGALTSRDSIVVIHSNEENGVWTTQSNVDMDLVETPKQEDTMALLAPVAMEADDLSDDASMTSATAAEEDLMAGLPEYDEGPIEIEWADDCSSTMEGDLANQCVQEATDSLQSLQVTNSPTTGSNGGGSA